MYIGLDAHKTFSTVTVITEKGELIAQSKIRTFEKEWYDFFERLSRRAKLMIAFEANSMLRKLLSELEVYGNVKVAHPTKVRLIAETKLKTDKKDSLALAKLLRLDELPEVYVNRNEEELKLRALTRERLRLKHDVSKYKCQIRHLLLINGVLLTGNIFTKKRREELRSYNIAEIDRRLSFMERIEDEIDLINEGIKDFVFSDFNRKLEVLTSIPGIGLYIASLLLSEIGNIDRFSSFRKLACYAGLIPSVHQSANKVYYGRITRQGNKYIRWALVEAANVAIKIDQNLRTFYNRLARKKGHNKAIVATAKKILKIVFTLLKRDEVYRSPA